MHITWRRKNFFYGVEAQHTCCTSSAADGLVAGLGCSILSTTERRIGRCASRTSGLPTALSLGTFSPATQYQGFSLRSGSTCSASPSTDDVAEHGLKILSLEHME